jgi:DNA topoisomerase VI subunit B
VCEREQLSADVSCPQDNGGGMRHEDIPEMLGRVLSGTKFGVRQTRGKFGLGAKMALIWSKVPAFARPSDRNLAPATAACADWLVISNAYEGTPVCCWQMSTGMPVEVLSAKPGQSFMSYYKLDIDIHKYAGHLCC